MEFRDIDYFAAVAEHGHVGRAAEALGLSQPALSLSLRRLEKAVRSKLVTRTPKGIALTAVGVVLLAQVHRLRLARNDVLRQIGDMTQGRAGHLRVGAAAGVPEALAAESCAVLLRAEAKLTLDLNIGSLDYLESLLRTDKLDLMVSGVSTVPTEPLTHEHILTDEFVVYASAKHRLATRRRVGISDLARMRWVMSDTGVPVRELRRAFEQEGLGAPAIGLFSNAASVRCRVVGNSNLLGFMAKPLLQQVARTYDLVELPVKALSWKRNVGVIYRKDAYLSPLAQRFIEILKKTAKELGSH